MSFESGAQENRRGSNVPSLEQIDQLISNRIREVEKQLNLIAPALRELAEKIEQEKPHAVVFLDVSARIFGTPYLKHLRKKMGDETPDIGFFNDHLLKARQETQQDFADTAKELFKDYTGKKVFFIDETYSNGKGAIAIVEAAEVANVDAYYFAFSQDPSPNSDYELSDEEEATINVAKEEGRVIISNNPFSNLFSRWASRLYVQDFQGETMPLARQTQTTARAAGGIPDANSYVVPPDGMTQQEYAEAASKKMDDAARTIKDLIYQKLEVIDPEPENARKKAAPVLIVRDEGDF